VGDFYTVVFFSKMSFLQSASTQDENDLMESHFPFEKMLNFEVFHMPKLFSLSYFSTPACLCAPERVTLFFLYIIYFHRCAPGWATIKLCLLFIFYTVYHHLSCVYSSEGNQIHCVSFSFLFSPNKRAPGRAALYYLFISVFFGTCPSVDSPENFQNKTAFF